MKAATGPSPSARRRRAADSLVPPIGGRPRGHLGTKLGAFTVAGMPVPVDASFASRSAPTLKVNVETQGQGEHAELDDALDDNRKPHPQVIRHNACFLHSQGMEEVYGSLHTRPVLAGCRYSDMVKETIYMKGSQDLERLGRNITAAREHEVAHREWSKTRFQRQRDNAALWETLRAGSVDSENHKFDDSAARNPEATLPAPPVTRSAEDPMHGPAGAATQSPKSIVPELRDLIKSYGPKRDTMRNLQRSTSVPNATGCQQWPSWQPPGTRGLPPDLIPAQATRMGVMIWPKGKSHRLA